MKFIDQIEDHCVELVLALSNEGEDEDIILSRMVQLSLPLVYEAAMNQDMEVDYA